MPQQPWEPSPQQALPCARRARGSGELVVALARGWRAGSALSSDRQPGEEMQG